MEGTRSLDSKSDVKAVLWDELGRPWEPGDLVLINVPCSTYLNLQCPLSHDAIRILTIIPFGVRWIDVWSRGDYVIFKIIVERWWEPWKIIARRNRRYAKLNTKSVWWQSLWGRSTASCDPKIILYKTIIDRVGEQIGVGIYLNHRHWEKFEIIYWRVWYAEHHSFSSSDSTCTAGRGKLLAEARIYNGLRGVIRQRCMKVVS